MQLRNIGKEKCIVSPTNNCAVPAHYFPTRVYYYAIDSGTMHLQRVIDT